MTSARLLWLAITAAGAIDMGGLASMSAAETVVITAERLSQQPIDLKQGGQFIEPLCHLIPSMLAQQVANDSFEEEPPYRVAHKAETDQPYRPWYPDGAVHRATYSFDTRSPFNGTRSLAIALPQERCRAGISQDGFHLVRGLGYRLRLHLRSEGQVAVSAWLHGGGASLTEVVSLGQAPAEWAPAEGTLKALGDSANATLTIEFGGPGTLWLDRVSLIGEDAVLGLWRPDVVEALRALNPGTVRWGGSTMEGYEWSEGIGPWDRRAPFTTCWGGLEPNFVGTEEFVQLCRHIGAEPLLCIRWSGKTPADAAAQVEYFNGPADSEWGRRRADNGHPEPYAVRYWQVGNEVSGQGYDASVRAFAAAMKAKDPAIRVLSSFLTDQTLPLGGGLLDYLCPHHYGCADLPGKDRDFAWIREQIARNGDGPAVRVAVTEWNTTAGDWGLGRASLQTLSNALACARYQNLMHRHADLVEIAIRSNLVDSFGSGVIVTGPGWLYLAPTYYAQQLYQRAAGSYPLRLQRTPQVAWHEQAPDLSATLSPEGQALRLYAVNPTATAIETAFRTEGLGPGVRRASARVLKDRREALCPEVMNTRDEPGRIAVSARPAELGGPAFAFTFEPYSLTLLELELGR